ncbi:hypothetical protein Tco_1258449, partial [Tanacetum coccineum]
EVIPDAADNSRPIFDTEPLQKVSDISKMDKNEAKQDKSEHEIRRA